MGFPRVAFVLLWFPLPSETFIFNEVDRLREIGVPLRVFTLYGPWKRNLSVAMEAFPGTVERLGLPFLREAHFDVIHWWRKNPSLVKRLFRTVPVRRWSDPEMAGENLWAFLCAFRLARRFEEEKIEHIHASWAGGPATAAWIASELTGIPFSFSGHAADIYPPDGALEEKIRACAFVRTENHANVEHLKRLAPGEESKIHMVHNGLDMIPGSFARRPLVPPYRIRALGRLVPKKGFDVLIRSCRILEECGLDFQLAVAGSGHCREALVNLARELKLEGKISFPGFITHDRVSEFLASGDVFVMPSVVDPTGDRDGLPNVILEALLHKLPVVATDVCAIGEIVQDGTTGFLVPQKDPFALARAIVKAVGDRESGARMAEKGRSMVLEQFGLDDVARKLLKYILEATPAAGR